ncbi:30S ribosomal protein S20 [Candidatus Uhrbacteria bacterium RIFCSPLOWO2_12_FULL_46_10]|uniref:Small ribosomal subunit protein bS20 n=1 Tax=Candidatus Uhrbacteria bacterium RIFCSPLOWO2_01_FULL_47_25 TaxID=1802402 RepID=A0A1F7UWI4_9BACT|nr:MAG: ribosomal protein S20 [Parcubacteria group bacterium GW2011_GWA2_46_9]OGL60009.1 MAG: 30S ribosomal protein S20 [Candidatus Uhrbacteria bacterium RIFCSPHIGHO2_01_FULL_46_23]OGL69507.1 MAG: 30S ribosomal protein S20 [Candidatus Uhrbacteria bacterium RIFCSPHIGHO2_02_FULL_47_29]OGL82635.1 MAG: 30S ribosomal protein S20 [Candidatus Uhrbacteria bacterium RIFCSPLOWO2_01_FULL_47_25]OGL86679.1 MAG: 30S ribosomal protein S20 [Candidatus Uhrbacteria bacterium RIFCSPLOWO2_02_FULL_46_19]OGL90598.1
MPNKPSSIKDLRQSKKRMFINRKVKDDLRRVIKKARRLTEVKNAAAQQLLKTTVKMIDKAVHKKVLKKNAAARTKSRLMKLWHKSR